MRTEASPFERGIVDLAIAGKSVLVVSLSHKHSQWIRRRIEHLIRDEVAPAARIEYQSVHTVRPGRTFDEVVEDGFVIGAFPFERWDEQAMFLKSLRKPKDQQPIPA